MPRDTGSRTQSDAAAWEHATHGYEPDDRAPTRSEAELEKALDHGATVRMAPHGGGW